ncbi:DNA alkylation repair protein [Sorangium sp. So ce1335]|uniref:DNA alkylation repair protein n=1 Tax=Sorangium sp. So ce1335 TaxID=3133335 RepID=UPI003F624148
MADRLKNLFDEGSVRSIARALRSAHPRLDERGFARDCLAGLADLELTGRASHIADVMHHHLPQPFPRAAQVIVASLGPELARSDVFGLEPLLYMPHVFYVAKRGLDHFEEAMTAQYELTKRFSAEFSIRAFLTRHADATIRRLRAWAADPNVHVRRLVSEGTRPRLPWAPRLRAFQQDPGPVIDLLELLKDDPERYVQRSVANNINDISKDHPTIAASLCRRWLDDAPPGRRWIVGHALRSLVKKGDRGALDALGFGEEPRVEIARVSLAPRPVKLGGELRFSFELTSTAPRDQELLVDCAVHFVKANGATRPRVFKLRKLILPPSGRAEIAGKVSFEEMTTRRHYPGRHRIDAMINGVAHPLGQFEVG